MPYMKHLIYLGIKWFKSKTIKIFVFSIINLKYCKVIQGSFKTHTLLKHAVLQHLN